MSPPFQPDRHQSRLTFLEPDLQDCIVYHTDKVCRIRLQQASLQPGQSNNGNDTVTALGLEWGSLVSPELNATNPNPLTPPCHDAVFQTVPETPLIRWSGPCLSLDVANLVGPTCQPRDHILAAHPLGVNDDGIIVALVLEASCKVYCLRIIVSSKRFTIAGMTSLWDIVERGDRTNSLAQSVAHVNILTIEPDKDLISGHQQPLKKRLLIFALDMECRLAMAVVSSQGDSFMCSRAEIIQGHLDGIEVNSQDPTKQLIPARILITSELPEASRSIAEGLPDVSPLLTYLWNLSVSVVFSYGAALHVARYSTSLVAFHRQSLDDATTWELSVRDLHSRLTKLGDWSNLSSEKISRQDTTNSTSTQANCFISSRWILQWKMSVPLSTECFDLWSERLVPMPSRAHLAALTPPRANISFYRCADPTLSASNYSTNMDDGERLLLCLVNEMIESNELNHDLIGEVWDPIAKMVSPFNQHYPTERCTPDSPNDDLTDSEPPPRLLAIAYFHEASSAGDTLLSRPVINGCLRLYGEDQVYIGLKTSVTNKNSEYLCLTCFDNAHTAISYREAVVAAFVPESGGQVLGSLRSRPLHELLSDVSSYHPTEGLLHASLVLDLALSNEINDGDRRISLALKWLRGPLANLIKCAPPILLEHCIRSGKSLLDLRLDIVACLLERYEGRHGRGRIELVQSSDEETSMLHRLIIDAVTVPPKYARDLDLLAFRGDLIALSLERYILMFDPNSNKHTPMPRGDDKMHLYTSALQNELFNEYFVDLSKDGKTVMILGGRLVAGIISADVLSRPAVVASLKRIIDLGISGVWFHLVRGSGGPRSTAGSKDVVGWMSTALRVLSNDGELSALSTVERVDDLHLLIELLRFIVHDDQPALNALFSRLNLSDVLTHHLTPFVDHIDTANTDKGLRTNNDRLNDQPKTPQLLRIIDDRYLLHRMMQADPENAALWLRKTVDAILDEALTTGAPRNPKRAPNLFHDSPQLLLAQSQTMPGVSALDRALVRSLNGLLQWLLVETLSLEEDRQDEVAPENQTFTSTLRCLVSVLIANVGKLDASQQNLIFEFLTTTDAPIADWDRFFECIAPYSDGDLWSRRLYDFPVHSHEHRFLKKVLHL